MKTILKSELTQTKKTGSERSGEAESGDILIPVRSRLYHLKPMGVGTPLVESLTGYIQRLAIAHNVTTGTLMSKAIIPALKNQKLSDTMSRGGGRIYERAYSFNGQNKATLAFVKIVESLTLREDLIYLTMLPWADVLPCKTLFRETRAWCPICYEKWAKEGHTVYEPLIWALNQINVCPEHFHPLVSECPHCKRTMNLHTAKSRPGYCCRCGLWLGNDINGYKTDTGDTWDVENFKSLIAEGPNIGQFPKRQTVLAGLIKYIDDYYASSTTKFASAFNISRSVILRWRRGAYPSLETLLRLCRETKTLLVQLFTTGTLNRPIENPGTVPPYGQNKTIHARFLKKINYAELKDKLEQILVGCLTMENSFEAPPSMQQVAKALGCSKRTLYKRFPELCKGIAAKASAYREQRKQRRLKEICGTVRDICRNTYPSYDAVARELGPRSGVLREKAVRAVWKKEHALFVEQKLFNIVRPQC